ncbi:MAG TPA: hypothetical protein VM009_07535 [Terriglobales bacterium]|nr:hypothetical protein [Terriglobales bacterium]
MHDPVSIPEVLPSPILALFRDVHGARTAVETMLQGGFLGEQLGLMAVEDSVPSPANDMSIYRATGLRDSGSPIGMDQPFGAGNFSDTKAEMRNQGVIVSVQPATGQERNAREMLVALGGRLLRPDGSIETEAA